MIESIVTYLEEELTEITGSAFQIKRKVELSGGSISRAMRLETNKGNFFLKWNFSCPDDLFVREAEGLRELRRLVGNDLVVPEVILAKEADELAGFIVLEYLEQANTPGQDEKLGIGLARLHRIQPKEYGFENDNFCGSTIQKNDWCESWIDFFGENRLRFLLQLIENARPFEVAETELFESLIERLPALLPESPGASLIHGDLWSGNLMHTTRGPALIDPAVYFAHREMELSIMKLFGGFSTQTWEAYNDAFPLERGWEQRVELYQIYHLLNHWYLFGGHYGRQAADLARKFV